jgi:hypothetical protein
MYQDSQHRPAIKPIVSSDAPQVMPHEEVSQPATSLDGQSFNDKLREMVSSLKQGSHSAGIIVDFQEVCEGTVRTLSKGDNLSVLFTPLAANGAHGRAFFELFGVGTNGDNILRFCQQELNMSADEATKFLTPPKRKGASKDQEVVLPLSLESASPWVKEFMAEHWNVPGANIALAIRHTGDRVSVGVSLGFEPLRSDVGNQLIRGERSGGALSSGFAKCDEALRPFGALVRGVAQLSQNLLCLPTALRKGFGNSDLEARVFLGILSGVHLTLCAASALAGTSTLLEFNGLEMLTKHGVITLDLLSKYGAIVTLCNIYSLGYEWGGAYKRHQSDKPSAAAKSSKQGGAS